MGEKLLAQRVLALLRDTISGTSRQAAVVVDWANDHRDWLWPGATKPSEKRRRLTWAAVSQRVDGIAPEDEAEPLFAGVDLVARLLNLSDFDRELIRVVAALDRLPRIEKLQSGLIAEGADLLRLAGRLAGASASGAASRVRRSQAVALGLLEIDRSSRGRSISPEWLFSCLLDEEEIDEGRVIAALLGPAQEANLGRADFVEIDADVDLLIRLLQGAIRTRARGVNILIHGPPGTGKTELARMLAAEAGATLFAVGEMDDDGHEPSRFERLQALQRSQRLLANKAGSALLFDEMEDLFAEASYSASGSRRSGSKIFVNRLLEDVAVPVIWTSNSIACVDAAHLRRLSFILRLDHASPRGRLRIADRAGVAEGAADAVDGLAPILESVRESASVARVALRSAALADGNGDDAAASARSLLLGLRGGRSLPPEIASHDLDLGLYQARTDVRELIDRLASGDTRHDFSLLLTGPPGTGKTALAAHLARRLDRTISVKRTSDLLSKWVGGTEANIADAFAEARDEGAVLFFDEADSLLLDRADARHSWEVSQVNELLTWMESHPLPFIAATNFARRLDPAAMRRFVFKLDLEPLSGRALGHAFTRFFDLPPPEALGAMTGLTPGDFAVVRRQLKYLAPQSSSNLLTLLQNEVDAKPDQSGRIGF